MGSSSTHRDTLSQTAIRETPLSGRSLVRGVYREYSFAKIEHEAFDPEFSLTLATNGLHLALDAAARAKRNLPIAQTIGGQWDEALRAGLSNRDVAGAYLQLQ